MVKNPPASARDVGDTGSIPGKFDPWVGKITWRMEQQPTPVFLPGEFCGQWSLLGCFAVLWVAKESDTTEHLRTQVTYGMC